MTNTFDAAKINKQILEVQQKEKQKKVIDSVRYHEAEQKLTRISDGKQLAKELVDLDFTTDYNELGDAAQQDALDRAASSELLFPEMGDFALFGPRSLALFCAATGTGKCFGKDTEILMFDGSIKKVQDISLNDQVMGPDSKPRKVLSLAHGQEEMFRVTPVKGDPYIVNKSHILSLKVTTRRKVWKKYEHGDIINISVSDYIKTPKGFRHNTKGYRAGVDFVNRIVPIDPYLIGYWLGDGDSNGPRFVTADPEVTHRLQQSIDSMNIDAVNKISMKFICAKGKAKSYGITTNSHKKGSNIFLNQLCELNILNNKHIPDIYKINSREVRLAIFAGILDSDGGGSDNCIDFCFKSKKLADDVVYLARSLGYAAYMHPVQKMCCNAKTKAIGTYYRISVSGDMSDIPSVLLRKQKHKRKQIKDVLHVGISVDSIGNGEYYGFSVDGDHLFLLSDFTVVHNSTLTANIAYSLMARGKRVLIIANEETRQDVAIRISCLQLGVNIHAYMRKNNIPQSVKDSVIDNVRRISDKQLSIVAQDYRNDSRYVTSAECVIALLDGVTKRKDTPEKYDAVIIDYYQNINQSINNPGLQAHEANEIFARQVDKIKNEIGCPIIMMAQIRPGDDYFITRLEGRRLILNKCTDILEIKIDKDNHRSLLKCHKDRWNGNQGEERFIAYNDQAKFIYYDKAFEDKVKNSRVDKIDALASDP